MVEEGLNNMGEEKVDESNGAVTLDNDSQVDISGADKVEDIKTEIKKSSRDKDNLYEEIEIPGGIEVKIDDDDVLIMKKDDRELRRELVALIDFKIEGNKIIMKAGRSRKIEKRLFGTFKAHIKNMIKGFAEGFTYKLKIANVHFPMNVSYDENNNELIVKNFLGEKKDRIIKLVPGVDVKVDNEDIIVVGYDIEKAGHVAAKIEKGTKVRNKDRRVYQDGIFIVEKPGRVFL